MRKTKIGARMILHSKCTTHDVELYTLEVTIPKSLVAQVNTHRTLARNSASSRAIPTAKIIAAVENDPYIPIFRQNKKGMQPGEPIPSPLQTTMRRRWLSVRDFAAEQARHLRDTGAAKEDVNRLLEPWMWTTILVTATDWRGFFAQRLPGAGAQDGIAQAAVAIKEAMAASEPQTLEPGEWHTPYTDGNRLASVAHCARVSYTKQGAESTPEALANLFDRLRTAGHWSPFEHVAQAMERPQRVRNFRGWEQLRAYWDERAYEE